MAERLSKKHRATLERIFRPQRRSNPGVSYREMVGLARALGASVDESRDGSRVAMDFPDGGRFTLHRPHGGRPVGGRVTALFRDFLAERGIEP